MVDPATGALVFPAPFFGGKRRLASEVWRRFGDVTNYIEPCLGSGAVLLARPADHARKIETVNDADGLLANVWRALRHDPVAVAHHADFPVSEVDLTARHLWLVGQRERITGKLETDPEWYDAKAAGWWIWGACAWIGSGWCDGRGPWGLAEDEDGNRQLVHLGDAGQGINRQLVHLGNAGRGINRQLVHLGDAGQGINRKLVRKLVHLGDAGKGSRTEYILQWMTALAVRLRDVRIACGDWSRVCTESVTTRHGLTGVFLDPPYSNAGGDEWAGGLYAVEGDITADVRAWAIEHGSDPLFRIALCGYDSLTMPDGWTAHRWSAHGGYGGGRGGRGEANRHREVVWFSRHCIPADRPASLWDWADAGALALHPGP